jgi:hypothetical protein
MYNTEQARQFLYSYLSVERDLPQPKVLIHVLNELVNG